MAHFSVQFFFSAVIARRILRFAPVNQMSVFSTEEVRMCRLRSCVIFLRGSCVKRCEGNFVRRSLTEVTAFRSLKVEALWCFPKRRKNPRRQQYT